MWQEVCQFVVDGIPKATPRIKARAVVTPGRKPFAQTYTPKTADQWKLMLTLAAKAHLPTQPLDEPIRLELVFRFPRPRSHYVANDPRRELKSPAPKWHTSKPDSDNLAKAVMDVLTQCGMYKDDSRVCCKVVTKLYAGEHNRPGVALRLFRWAPSF